jgi:hypothetical protein
MTTLDATFEYLHTHRPWLPTLVEAGQDSACMLRRSGLSGDGSQQTGHPVLRLYRLCSTLWLVRDGIMLWVWCASDETSKTACSTCSGVAHQ